MRDIVWLVDPKRDTLFDLISHLGDTYGETIASSGISFSTSDLEVLRDIRLKMERRQHLLLIFKEALNNSLKHSRATEISLSASVDGKRMSIILADNGRGFDTGSENPGNGLSNMRSRATDIGGSLTIESSPGTGTIIRFAGYS